MFSHLTLNKKKFILFVLLLTSINGILAIHPSNKMKAIEGKYLSDSKQNLINEENNKTFQNYNPMVNSIYELFIRCVKQIKIMLNENNQLSKKQASEKFYKMYFDLLERMGNAKEIRIETINFFLDLLNSSIRQVKQYEAKIPIKQSRYSILY